MERTSTDKPARPLTKIVATLGPATDDPAVLDRLIEHGASVFRLNYSHGSITDHEKRLGLVRAAEQRCGVLLAVLGDLPGPKIRLGDVPPVECEWSPGEDESATSKRPRGIVLKPGQDVVIRSDISVSIPGEVPQLAANYPRLRDEVSPGQRVLINDGAVRLLAVDAGAGGLVCRVTVGGLVTSRKGLNLPDSALTVPSMTERDWELARWSVSHEVDYLALSFVRAPEDVAQLQRELDRLGAPADRIPVIAKIETRQAVEAMDSIVSRSDGIMIARGDLGVELDLAMVPVVQKRLAECAHRMGKPCICATQMLETMIERATATRAEVSDVANAIVDRVDAVMLSGETAVGRHPALAVQTMSRVAVEIEKWLAAQRWSWSPPKELRERRDRVAALAHGARHMAHDVGARLVVVWSQSGGTAQLLSRNSFHVPIVGFTTDRRAVRRMSLYQGVFPVLQDRLPLHRTEFAQRADATVQQLGLAQPGEMMVVMGGMPFDQPGTANTVAIRRVGELTGAGVRDH